MHVHDQKVTKYDVSYMMITINQQHETENNDKVDKPNKELDQH